MNHLIIAPLFFFLGALVSWLFFAWKIDKDDSVLSRRINDLEYDNRALRNYNDIYRTVMAQWEQLELNKLKYKAKQEKQKCPE